MPSKKNTLKTTNDLTLKQRKFVDILATNWGRISKVDACIEAGYSRKDGKKPYITASKLTNPELNPHVQRYLEKRLSQELHKYENDKLRSFKSLEHIRNKAEEKNQLNTAVQSEFRMGQLAGFYVAKSEVSHVGLEGMSREQLEKRLSELENKLEVNNAIIDITAETEIAK
jgi:phage terminase small subunit